MKAFLKGKKKKYGSVFRRIEHTLFVVELSVLHGVSGKRKEQYGTRNFLKATIAGLWVTFSFSLRFISYASRVEIKHVAGMALKK